MARLVRCPVCLRPSRDPGPRGQLRCRGCRRLFSGATALPFDASRTAVAGAHADLLLHGGVAVVGACIVFFVVARMDWVTAGTDGLAFLWRFLLLGLLLRLALGLVRRLGLDTPLVTLAALGVFEGVGLVRWLGTRDTAMHEFELLAVAMGLGVLVFLVRVEGGGRPERAAGSGAAGGSSASCGGCGSSGGCGGCGGD